MSRELTNNLLSEGAGNGPSLNSQDKSHSNIITSDNIKSAYKSRDGNLSKHLHMQKLNSNSVSKANEMLPIANEEHKSFGDYVKSIIYGGLDGIVTTFAIVTGVRGAELDTEIILVLGICNLVADGLSMGVGDFLSEKAELDYAYSEREREKWEFDNYREGEIQEMIDIYKDNHGMKHEHAETIIKTMALYPKFFIDHMMIQELDIQPPSGDENPLKQGLVTLGSFLVFGSVPLLSYVFFTMVDFKDTNTKLKEPEFIISIIFTVTTLFILGAVKAKLTQSNWIKSGLFVTGNGVLAAGASYLIGFGLSQLYVD